MADNKTEISIGHRWAVNCAVAISSAYPTTNDDKDIQKSITYWRDWFLKIDKEYMAEKMPLPEAQKKFIADSIPEGLEEKKFQAEEMAEKEALPIILE